MPPILEHPLSFGESLHPLVWSMVSCRISQPIVISNPEQNIDLFMPMCYWVQVSDHFLILAHSEADWILLLLSLLHLSSCDCGLSHLVPVSVFCQTI